MTLLNAIVKKLNEDEKYFALVDNTLPETNNISRK